MMSNLIALLILKTIQEMDGRSYGYEIKNSIIKTIKRDVPEGTLYPLLSKFVKHELLTSEKEKVSSSSKRERKYYYITDKGKQQTSLWVSKWNDLKESFDSLLNQVEVQT